MDRSARVLVRIGSALGGDGVELVAHRKSRIEVAVLEDDGGVSEDEIYCSVDVAFSVELAESVRVESVLVAFEAAAVEG